LTLCTAVYDDKGATSEDVADAYHLAGWVKIHGTVLQCSFRF
jgi:hypothetical protein